ncbi:hypothetical protein ISN44_Un27g000010 [Arabidopsis suecica]|uniref:Senescence-associated protein n=1 Tax=Arabidopsis suecica TaxID=45249 RepID=A0A8T1XKY4_ARASU|nr:hypothetical protein ISN44_Un27g000010 [Arabidopsis suecica]
MIGRADIEGSKSNVAMNAWLPQASYPCGNFSDTSSFKFRRSKGSIGHAFTVRIRTENQNQTSFYPFVPHEISVLVELILGHLRYLLTDVPPQPNSPPDNVLRPDRPAEASLGSKNRGCTPPPTHGSFHKVGLESSSTGSSFPADSAKPVPLAVVSLDSRQGHRIPLVRTSSELTVRRPGKALERAVPSPSPGRHAATRSRRGSSSSSPPTADGFGTGTPEPSPQSQSFSRSYGSILPTSLAYIVPSTRGCSPWRPDAVMSTTGRERHSVLRIFKGRRGRTGHHATCGALPAAGPYLRLSRFQDLHRRPLRPGSRPRFYSDRRALLLIEAWLLPRRPGIGRALQRHPFSGLVDSAGMLTLEPFSEDQGRSAVHPRGIPPISFLAPYGFTHPLTRTHVRLLGPCFKTGRMGSPQADARSTQMPRHAVKARAADHDHGSDVSAGHDLLLTKTLKTLTLKIAATIHRGYCSSPLLFIAVTNHRRYCSSRLLFIAATVHRGYCSSPLLFIAATIHRRYCSSRLLFIAVTVHHGTVHRRHCSSRYCLRFVAAAPQRIRKNPKNLTTSKVIDHTAVTVVDGKDVVVATITHPAVGTTITVDVDPIPAVVEGEDDVAHPLSSPMVVRSLGLDSDPFGPKKDEEEVLGPEVPYLSAIGALMYLASHTRPDICFAVNLLCLNLVHDQPKGTGKAVFFKAQLLQHQRPSYEDTTQPVSLSSRTATSREIGRSTFYQSSSSRMTYKGMEKFEWYKFNPSFSSLPRGTCSLSVSRPYLALDGIYRPIGAAFPNNPTRRQRLVVRQGPGTTGLSPSLAPLSRELRPGPSLRTLLQTTIRTPKTSDFQAGLFPVRSPLLRESLTLGHLQLPDRSDRQYQMDHVHHRMSGRSRRPWLGFRPTACGNTRETSFRPASAKEYRGRRFVTPRQTCPRPEGLGRNLRSKTRWFTGFCNSHQVSHFATFFIDARAEISVAESRFRLYIAAQHPRTHRLRGGECQPFVCLFLDTFRRYAKPRIRRARDRLRNRPTESGDRWFAGRSVLDRFSGLLATSRAANHPRRRDPNTSPDHSIGRSDGRQIAPPTKNGHAPPPIESRKSSQSVNPYYVWTCNSAGGTTRPIKTRSVSPTEGTSRPVHTKGGPADPSQGRMSFGGTESLRVTVYNFSASEISTGNLFTNANKATNAMSRVRYATQAPDPIIERNIAREVTEKDRCAKDTHETGSLVSLPADIHFPSKDGCQEHPQKFKAARCRCPWATLTPCSTRDSLGGSMLSNEARPSNLGGWNRCPWGHLGISGAFRIYRHPRPRRIHVSPCHDTPILFGDGVKRCPWGHLGIPCAFPIYRHPKASKNPCHPTHDTPILRDHSAIFVRELLKKLKNCDKTDRRKSRRKNFPAIIPAVGRSDSLSVMPPDNIPRSLPTRSERRFRRTDLANDTCLWEPKLLLRVGNRAAGACVASSPDSDLEAFSHNPAHGSFAPLAFQPSAMTNSHVPYWWVNNPTLGEFCFTMIGRADIEGSKSNVAMNAWLPQASYPCGNFSDTSSFKFRRSKGSIGHAFTVRIRTENQNQTSFYPFVPHEISVLVELILGHLRYLLTDVPPQPNSPPDNVLRPDRPAEASLGSKNRGCTPPPTHGSFHKVGLESSSTGSSFPADSAKPVPLAVVSLDSRQGHRIPLVRTSSELTVRRPGKALERAVPSPSPGRHAATRSRRGSSSSSPPTADGFGTGTPEPSPQSQSFSRSYGSILPTSLAYIVPSTRGCSPWRPDAVMSTTGRERHSVLRIFKGRRGRTGHHATCGALPAAGPYLRLSRFQDLHRRPLRPGSRPRFYSDRRALLLIEAWLLPRRPGIGRALQRHPFSGLVDSAVGHRNPASGSSRIASSAYQKWPTWSSRFRVTAQQSSRHNSRPSSSYPEGNFGGNQLLDGSISLSPLYPSQTNDLHVSMLTLEPFSEDQGRSAVHPRGIPPISFLAPYGFTHPLTRTHVRLLGPCFKTGRMGSPQADARSTQMPRHAVKARAADHDHGSDVSAGVSKARA